MSDYAIEIENLRKSFRKINVLKGVNLNVKPGEVLTLLGPNGAGKTTIIRILSTLLKPDSGTVIVNGYNLKTQPQEIRRSIGLTGQYT
ncbi:MAG TPA: ABC transporter ATP-binding protein, partial [Candidatus Atribacteria bacterium]|nr:ABC transporter ATP-binding protein [Candidatus Atribacteria bacterium]